MIHKNHNPPAISPRSNQPAAGSDTAGERWGSSLIEVVIAIGVASVMMATGLGVIHLLLQAERGETRGIVYSTSLSRLSRAMREDVHAARNGEILPAAAESNARLKLSDAKGEIATYEIKQHTLVRTSPSEADGARHERFVFPESTVIEFAGLDESQRIRIVLNIPRNPHTETRGDTTIESRSRIIHLEAVLSRDHRFVSQEPEQ